MLRRNVFIAAELNELRCDAQQVCSASMEETSDGLTEDGLEANDDQAH